MAWKEKQSVSLYRKLLLRRHLMRRIVHTSGDVYAPFIGDAEIAEALYTDSTFCGPNRVIFGADIDPDRVVTARDTFKTKHPGHPTDIRVADCDSWPFADLPATKFCIADFDAWADPWPSFRSFWKQADKADRVAMFFTDGHRLSTLANKWIIYPDGTKRLAKDLNEQRSVYNFYLPKWIWPWFQDYIKPYRMTMKLRYLRDQMTYWGCVVELPSSAGPARVESKANAKVPTKPAKASRGR